MATKTAEDVYKTTVRRLPVAERLRLAALILNGVVPPGAAAKIDEQDSWSEEDLRDLTLTASWYAAQTDEKA
jgi:hypothetical protein